MSFDPLDEPSTPFGQTDLEIADLHDQWETDIDLAGQETEDDDLVAPSDEEVAALLNQINIANVTQAVETPEPLSADPAVADTRPRDGLPGSVVGPASGATAPVTVIDDQTALQAINALDPELREAFLDDASHCVGTMEQSLLELESDPTNANALNQICRELHTLKGASASVGLTGLADQLHGLEDTLRDDHDHGRTPDVDSLLKSVDTIRLQIGGSADATSIATGAADVCLADSAPSTAIPPQPPHPAVTPVTQTNPATPTTPAIPAAASFDEGPDDDESVRVKTSQLNRLMDMLAQLVMLRNRRETELADLQEVYHELIGSVSKMRMLSNEIDPESAVCSSLQLSEVANDVLEIAGQVRDCARPIAAGNTAVSQFIREFRQELVELRRTPIGGLFKRLQRVVRDAAASEQKQVRLQLVGESAGIERALQQRLYEPLLHIVRNSVCHGIESPQERQQRGKGACGTITLEAKSGADHFVIEIRDDGRGLDYEAIRRRGIESGLLSPDQGVTRQELSQLIFRPGFSTRQTADQIAGRGVGMDVVATTLQRMQGWLEVDSEANRGTRIRLSFPLPSVIQHAMVFRAAGQLFAVPMQSVQTTGDADHSSAQLVFAAMIAEQDDQSIAASQQIVLSCKAPIGTGKAGSANRIALLVDEIVGPEELVVRPLPSILKHHPYCSGASLSGMGQTVLFLDARRVVESQKHRIGRRSEQPVAGRVAQVRPTRPPQFTRPRVLVADDSISARKRVVRSLRRYAVEIVEACDGKQALEIMKGETFAAVFSDMEMPHVSGMELLADINSANHDDPPPVVIISSRGENEFTERARELGANNYIIKPLADETLDLAIQGIPSLCHLTPHQPTDSLPSGAKS